MNSTPSCQRGAALAVSLILLVIMTVLGINAISRNIGQERMAGASMERNVAMQLADASRKDAEEWMAKRVTWPAPSNIAGQPPVWTRNALGVPGITDYEWVLGAGQPVRQWAGANWTSARMWNFGERTASAPADLAAVNAATPRYFTVEWANPIDNEVDTEKKDKGMSTFFYSTYAHGLSASGLARATVMSVEPKIFK